MHHSSPSRRALGLAAAGAIALSPTVLSLGGVAHAAPAPLPDLSFSTDPDRVADGYTLIEGTLEVPEGYCGIQWAVIGGQGGSSSDGAGDDGTHADEVTGTTAATPGAYSVTVGKIGSPGTPEAGGDGGAGATAGEAGSAAGYGGGGGSTQVAGPGDLVITAAGGDGVGVDGPGGAGGGTSGFTVDGGELAAAVTGALGTGLVEAVVLPCQVADPAPVPAPAPGVPYDVTVEDGDGRTLVRFAQTFGDDETTSNPESYEYRVDSGPWQSATTTWDEAHQRVSFPVTGLDNGSAYAIQVRALNHEGLAGEPTEPVTARPFVAAGPPTAVTATPGVASVRVDWDPVADPGTYGVDHYEVDLVYSNSQTSGRENVCQTTDIFSCLIGLDTEVGFTYSVVVTSVDDHGHQGADSVVVPVAAAAAPAVPAAVPASDGTIVRADGGTGSVPAGSSMTLSGDGYLPGSTVTVVVYSEPQVLGHTLADVDGHWELTVVLPAGLVSGEHTLVASGVDPAGNPRFLTLPITVTGGAAAPAGPSGGLAYTGADVAVPAIGGLAALAVGSGLVLAGRRRRSAD